MKRNDAHDAVMKIIILLVTLFTVLWASLTLSVAQEPAKLAAVVAASEGDVSVLRDKAEEESKLATGDIVNLWDAVHSQAGSRVLLRWDSGLMTSMGAFSSLALTWGEAQGTPAPVIQVPEGVVRFAPKQRDERSNPYIVTTPTASIEPDISGAPADFIVETYDASTTVVTVIAGRVKVKNLRKADSAEPVVLPCQTAYVEEDKSKIDIVPSTTEALQKLVNDSTIPGTIIASLDVCPVETAQSEAAPPYVAPPTVVPQPYWTGTYVDPWPFCDDWFDGITVGPCPWLSGGILVNIPVFGSVVVEVPSYGPWACNRAVIAPFVRHWLYRHAWDWHRRWGDDWRLRRREAFGLVHVAHAMRDPRLWWRARRELDHLGTRSRWAAHRMRGFQQRMSDIEASQRRVRWRIPAGADLQRAVEQAFRSPRNVETLRNLQNRLTDDRLLQSRLTRSGEREANRLASTLSRERDPRNRLAMRENLGTMRAQLAEGRVPVSRQNSEIGTLVSNLRNTSDLQARAQARERLGRDLTRMGVAQTSPFLNQENVASLRNAAPANLSPAGRQRFDRGLNELQQAVQTRSRSQEDARRYNQILDRAANERDLGRRSALMSSIPSSQNRDVAPSGFTNRFAPSGNSENGLKGQRGRVQNDAARSLRENQSRVNMESGQTSRQFQRPSGDTRAMRNWNAERERQLTIRRQQENLTRMRQTSPLMRQRQGSTGSTGSLRETNPRFRQGSYHPSTINRDRTNAVPQGISRQNQMQRAPLSIQRSIRQPASHSQMRQPQNTHRQFSVPRAQPQRNTTFQRHSTPQRSVNRSIGSSTGRVSAPSASRGQQSRR